MPAVPALERLGEPADRLRALGVMQHEEGFMRGFRRRELLAGLGAIGAAGFMASPLFADDEAPSRVRRRRRRLPARGEFLIRNAHVMTMDPALGDIAGGAVHIKEGRIVAVGRNLKAPGAEVIDGTRMIVMPGLVDTHWHMWNTLYRSFSGDKADQGYFPTVARFGQQMTPDDMYQSSRLSAAEAINSGITTVHDWCHNVRSRAHAEADIRALRESGLRARFSYGWAQGLPDTQTCNLADLEGLARDWKDYAADGLISLGFGWRGKFRVSPIPPEVYRTEFETARKLGLPISVHVGSARKAKGQIESHVKDGLLGPDVNIVHALSASPEEIEMVKASGATVSLSPGSELRIGFGLTPTSEFLAAGVPLGMAIDTTSLSGTANLFSILKLARDVENGKNESEFKLTAHRMLEIGTIGGARAMGLGDVTGSLTPGKRADVIMISTTGLNIGVFTDPAHMALECTTPENVDTVIVDGRMLKSSGKLTALSTPAIVREAQAALAGVRKRTGWR
jgi:5-methylthioadenosine/S-adenosylhomocysteine deaminase